MFHKAKGLLLIGLLVAGMVALLANDARAPALPPGFAGGFGLHTSDLCADSILGHVRNADKQPSLVEVRLVNFVVRLRCLNPGGGDGGLGHPFFYSAEILGRDSVEPDHVTKNGRYLSEVCFSDCDLWEALFPGGPPPASEVCAGPGNKEKWSLLNPCEVSTYEGHAVLVEEVDVLYLAFYEPGGPGTGYVLSDWEAFHAVLTADGVNYALTPCDPGYIPDTNPFDVPLEPGDYRVWGGCGVGFPSP